MEFLVILIAICDISGIEIFALMLATLALFIAYSALTEVTDNHYFKVNDDLSIWMGMHFRVLKYSICFSCIIHNYCFCIFSSNFVAFSE